MTAPTPRKVPRTAAGLTLLAQRSPFNGGKHASITKRFEEWPTTIVAIEAESAALTRTEPQTLTLDVLPPDTVCACLHETGERKVRLYERCERCGAFMEADREPLDVERLAQAMRAAHLRSLRGGPDDDAESIAAEYARLAEDADKT